VFIKVYGTGGSAKELKHFIDQNELIFRKQLTRQYQLLDMLEGNQQILVEGGAGSGKTWNAVEKAVRLAEGGAGEGEGEGRHEHLAYCDGVAADPARDHEAVRLAVGRADGIDVAHGRGGHD
jgi:hypothetical protein